MKQNKNRIADLAKLLRVELGEEFIVTRPNGDLNAKITSDGLKWSSYGGTPAEGDILELIITGVYGIKKKYFKPDVSDRYFFINNSIDCPEVEAIHWMETVLDYMRFAVGNCFKTMEEAELHKDEMIEFLKSTHDKKPLRVNKDEKDSR